MLGCFGRRKRVKSCVHIVIPDGGVSGRMMLQQALCYFGDIEPFLRENEEMSPAMRRHLLEIFDDHQDAQDRRLELAAVVDAGVHFVSATYYLAGDTPLIFSCYEHLCSVAHAVAVEHYPNNTAVAREIAGGMLSHTTSL